MQTLGRFCLLVAAGHSVLALYHKFLRSSLRFLFMDFPSTFKLISQASELGCGFVLLGYFSRLFNLIGLLLIFAFCFRILRSSSEFGGKSSSSSPNPGFRSPQKAPALETHLKRNRVREDGGVSPSPEERDEGIEDEVFDVMSLRKLVKMERQRFNAACAEIEKERVAASSAAEEAMAMILRLQSEKSSVEIEANQFRRMVEERQEYDHEEIESLRWTVLQLESHKSLLEQQLEIYREKLAQFMKEEEEEEEIDQIEVEGEGEGGEAADADDAAKDFCNFSVEYDLDVSLEGASLETHSLG